MQYTQALRRLAIKALPNLPMDSQHQWVLDQFELGLNNTELQKHVKFGHPTGLNEAILLAIELEAFESGLKDKLRNH